MVYSTTDEDNNWFGASAGTATLEPSSTYGSVQPPATNVEETALNGHSVYVQNGEDVVSGNGVSLPQDRTALSATIMEVNGQISKISEETKGKVNLSPIAEDPTHAKAEDLSRIEQEILAKQQVVNKVQTRLDETGGAGSDDDDDNISQGFGMASIGARMRGAMLGKTNAAQDLKQALNSKQDPMAELKGSLGKHGISGGNNASHAEPFDHGLGNNHELEQLRMAIQQQQQQSQSMVRSLKNSA